MLELINKEFLNKDTFNSFNLKEYLKILPIVHFEDNNMLFPPQNSPWNESTCTGPQLRGHIVNAHFLPVVLADLGVPRYDIELSESRGFNLEWVAKKAYERLEEPPQTTAARFSSDEYWKRRNLYFAFGDIDGYRIMIVRSLLYIDQLGLAQVNWDRVKQVVPNVTEINLDLDRDSTEGPFQKPLTYHPSSFSRTSLTLEATALPADFFITAPSKTCNAASLPDL